MNVPIGEMDVDLERTPFGNRPTLALIIGCGDLGTKCARALGRRHPLLIVDIDAEALGKVIAALRHEGYGATGHVCDIADPDQVARLGKLLSEGPGVKVYAHVAAVAGAKVDWQTIIKINLTAVHMVAEAVSSHMVPGSAAIFISSTGAYFCPRGAELEALLDNPFGPDIYNKILEAYGGEPDFLESYFMAKQGVNRLAQRLALEWGPRQVRSLSVSPGLIDSTMGRTAGRVLPIWDGKYSDERVTRDEKAKIEVPLQRQTSLNEVVAVVDFLASDAASFVSGIDFPVCGGNVAFWRKCGMTQR